MKHLKSKISKVLVLYIVLFSSVITLVLTAIQLRIDYNNGIENIYQRINQIETTNLDSIRQSLWTLDQSSTQIQLNGLARIKDILLASIADKDNKPYASSGEINTANTITKKINIYKKYRDKNVALGTLTIVATKENVYQQLIDTVVIILVSQAIKTFLVSLFVLMVFHYLVTRHLEKISDYSGKLELTTRSEPLVLTRKNSRFFEGDELQTVADSINTMSNNVYKSYLDLIEKQQQLADREAKFSAMFNSMSDAIIFADPDRKVQQVNTAFIKQFGYGSDEIIGQTTKKLYANPEEYDEQGQQRYNKTSKTKPSLYEIDYRRKDDTVFSSETMGGAVKLDDGTQVGLIGIIRDITDKKRAAEDKLHLQKQLHQSQKMEAIGQLTGGIAHDFNNILASILGYAELTLTLLKNSPEPKLVHYIENINHAAERARDLVTQLLSYSSSAPSNPQVLNLSILINDVTSMIQPTMPSSITLLKEIDDIVPSVLMDNTQMHQIVMNLCINSRDAMSGAGTLTIKLSHDKNHSATCSSCNKTIVGDYVILTVEDTGTGIDDDILSNIFDPFLTTKEFGKGTGMGLSVVHGILHKHDSHIIVETELNVGTSFHLLIPPISEDAIRIDIEEAEDTNIISANTGKHILIVDDEESITMFLQDLFETYDYKVTTSNSSADALEFFRQSPTQFDLIITDQTMPEMSGLDMIRQIFKLNSSIPVILCSGYNEQVCEKEALDLGVAKYLGKPVSNQLMLQAVQEVLKT